MERATFVDRRDAFARLLGAGAVAVSARLADVRALLPITDFDSAPFDLDDEERSVLTFAADLRRTVASLAAEIERRRTAARARLAVHDGAASARDRVDALQGAARAILGEDFRLVPEFALAPTQRDEWRNALAAST